MTAPVFVVDGAALESAASGSCVTVSGNEGRHAVTVRRIRAGESVDLVDGLGHRASGTVDSVTGKDTLVVRLDSIGTDPTPQPHVTVVQALPKGDRGERAVELLTEVGVDAIVPWAAANCVTQWRADRAERSWLKWVDTAVAAAKQSRRARFPVVHPLASTRDVVGMVGSAQLALVLHEDADIAIGTVVLPTAGEVLVVVGPEGGLAAEELSTLVEAGALSVRLGPSVLRTSSAGIAAVAALLARSERWALPSDGDMPTSVSVEG